MEIGLGKAMKIRMDECNSATYVIFGLLLPYSSRGFISLLNFRLKCCGVECKIAVDIGQGGGRSVISCMHYANCYLLMCLLGEEAVNEWYSEINRVDFRNVESGQHKFYFTSTLLVGARMEGIWPEISRNRLRNY